MTVALTMNWDAMTEIEKTQWLSTHILGTEQSFEFGENKDTLWLINQCEQKVMNSHDRGLWIRNVTSEVSAHVYAGMSDAQVQHPDTLWLYYEFFHTAPAALRGRALYFAKRQLQV